jgi:cytochrome c peroxidase
MEWNFSLFFGLAVQLYEATLIADDTPFDRFATDPTALTPQEQLGLDIFLGTNSSGLNPTLVDGRCDSCHSLPEFTTHSVRNLQVEQDGVPQNMVEVMLMGNGQSAFYDNGIYNISTRKTTEDLGRAATAPALPPFINPLTQEPFPLSYVELALLKKAGKLPPEVAKFVPDVPQECSPGFFLNEATGACDIPAPVNDRIAVRGAFKTPSLRNVKYTGPYFRHGGDSTLRQVVEFYVRGGNFPATNFDDLDPDMESIPGLDLTRDPQAEERIQALVAFLDRALTDERVVFERAPFDHPELILPHGSGKSIRKAAVGADGKLYPIRPFLNLDPQEP